MNPEEFKDQCIICFAGEDWWFHNPHSNSHIMQSIVRSGRGNRVLFVNSTGIKMPDFSANGFFWKRVGNKLKSILRYLKKAEAHLYVLTPLAIPLIRGQERWVAGVNRILMIVQMRIIIALLRFKKPLIWVTAPVARDIALYLKNTIGSGLVYYCCDNLAIFPGVNQQYILGLEADIQSAADLSLFVNRQLAQERKDIGREPRLLNHGVDYSHFALVQQGRLAVPKDIQGMTRPMVGYIGEIKPLDFELVRFLAQGHPEISFVFIGDIYAGLSALNLPRNVIFLGKRPYQQLPEYMQMFDCLGLFYNIKDSFNHYRNPKKLMEYFATGKPVVSVDIMQIREFSDCLYIAGSYQEFSDMLIKALDHDSSAARERRIKIAQDHTWDAVARRVEEMILESGAAAQPPAKNERDMEQGYGRQKD